MKALPREHGTMRGYRQHKDRGEKQCDACKAARRPQGREGSGRKRSPAQMARNRQRSRERARSLPVEVRRATVLWHSHGLTPAGKQEMLDAQDGRCYLCGDELSYGEAVIDHDHACCSPTPMKQSLSCSYCRRGLACVRCNHVIGHAGDDPERLLRIAANLAAVLPIVQARIASKPLQLVLDSAEVVGLTRASDAGRQNLEAS
jgi:Recombination endonuclease VII